MNALIDHDVPNVITLYGGYRMELDQSSVKRRGSAFQKLCGTVLEQFRFRHILDAKIHKKREIPTNIPYIADAVVQLPNRFLHLRTVWQDDPGSNDKWLGFALKIEHLEVETLIINGGEGASPTALKWFNDYAKRSKYVLGVISFDQFVERCMNGELLIEV